MDVQLSAATNLKNLVQNLWQVDPANSENQPNLANSQQYAGSISAEDKQFILQNIVEAIDSCQHKGVR